MHLETIIFNYDDKLDKPKYMQLADALEVWLKSSKFPAGTKFPSDRQLAAFFKMGTITVSRSVNELVDRRLLERRVGAGTFIAPESPQLKWPQSNRIGLFCHDVIKEDGAYVSTVCNVLYRLCCQHGIDLVQLTRSPEQYEKTIMEYQLSAVIVLDPQSQFVPTLRKLSEQGAPLAALGVFMQAIKEFSFGSDHQAAAVAAVNYLAENGCKRIGIVLRGDNETGKNLDVKEREAGYLSGMWHNQLLVNPEWILNKNYGEDKVFKSAFRKLMRSANHPDALIVTAVSDVLSVYSMLHDAGMLIPQDVSVIAFDDAEYLSHLEPPLTVWHQEIADAGRDAFFYVKALMEKSSPSPHAPTVVRLIERNSCRKR